MNKNKHVIDMIFPIALFFVFISSCFIVLILSFHTYRKTVQLEQSNYQTRTALSYITQKIHQNDLIDSVSLQQSHLIVKANIQLIFMKIRVI